MNESRGRRMESTKRLLIVGDDAGLRTQNDRLFVGGFEAVYVPDGASALDYVERSGLPHLMVVHVDLPDMPGLSLCQNLQSMADLPIIVLSPESGAGQAVKALQYADDYVRLPIEMDELVMRIRRVLSRVDNFSYASGPLLEICGSLKVSYAEQRVIVEGNERHLTPTENALLQVLLKHRGNVVDADTLIERVWRTGVSIQDRNSLRVHMHRLRQKLERESNDPGLIQTERGVGYIFTDC